MYTFYLGFSWDSAWQKSWSSRVWPSPASWHTRPIPLVDRRVGPESASYSTAKTTAYSAVCFAVLWGVQDSVSVEAAASRRLGDQGSGGCRTKVVSRLHQRTISYPGSLLRGSIPEALSESSPIPISDVALWKLHYNNIYIYSPE